MHITYSSILEPAFTAHFITNVIIMKQHILASLIVLGLTAPAGAQYTKGSWEMTLLGGFNSISSSRNGGSGDAETYVGVFLSPAYYIIDGLAIEPEIGITTTLNGNETGIKLLANATYTFTSFSEGKKIAPYVKAGYGVSNGIEFQLGGTGTGLIWEVYDEFAVSVLNLGVGAKWLIGKDAAVRTELNYNNQSDSNVNGDYSLSRVGLLLGVSLLF